MKKVQFAEEEVRVLEPNDCIRLTDLPGSPYASVVDLIQALEGLADLLGDPPRTGQLRGISDALRVRFNL